MASDTQSERSKGGKQFFPLSRFDIALSHIDSLIAEYKRLGNGDKEALSRKLAEILDSVNYLHPFRDGNGRAQRKFLRLLASLAKCSNERVSPRGNSPINNRSATRSRRSGPASGNP